MPSSGMWHRVDLRRFGGMHCLHLQDRKIRERRIWLQPACIYTSTPQHVFMVGCLIKHRYSKIIFPPRLYTWFCHLLLLQGIVSFVLYDSVLKPASLLTQIRDPITLFSACRLSPFVLVTASCLSSVHSLNNTTVSNRVIIMKVLLAL
jgi:hypothetical protein